MNNNEQVEQACVVSDNQPGHEARFALNVNKYLREGWIFVPQSLVGVDTDYGPKWVVFLQRAKRTETNET